MTMASDLCQCKRAIKGRWHGPHHRVSCDEYASGYFEVIPTGRFARALRWLKRRLGR